MWNFHLNLCRVGCDNGCSGCDGGFLGSLCDVGVVNGSGGEVGGGDIGYCGCDNYCSNCCSKRSLENNVSVWFVTFV